MRYTLRQLEVFLAVARTGSVSRAGDDLAMSQSAVSSALADLERQFDVLLFDRLGKRLRLSDFGTGLRPQAEAVLDRARELESALMQAEGSARLHIGATLTIGNYVAVPLMARFLADHPEAKVALDIANTEEIVRRVLNFEIDVGLVEGELVHPALVVTPFQEDELVVFSAPTHPLARRRTLTDDELKGVAWILREHGSGTRQTFDRAMSGLLPELNVALELRYIAVIKRAVEAGLGVGCLSRISLVDEIARKSVKTYRVPQRDFRRRFYFVLHRQKHVTATIRDWLVLCQGKGATAP
jgi:DNA-binding transcriptional LysR family regulator